MLKWYTRPPCLRFCKNNFHFYSLYQTVAFPRYEEQVLVGVITPCCAFFQCARAHIPIAGETKGTFTANSFLSLPTVVSGVYNAEPHILTDDHSCGSFVGFCTVITWFNHADGDAGHPSGILYHYELVVLGFINTTNGAKAEAYDATCSRSDQAISLRQHEEELVLNLVIWNSRSDQ